MVFFKHTKAHNRQNKQKNKNKARQTTNKQTHKTKQHKQQTNKKTNTKQQKQNTNKENTNKKQHTKNTDKQILAEGMSQYDIRVDLGRENREHGDHARADGSGRDGHLWRARRALRRLELEASSSRRTAPCCQVPNVRRQLVDGGSLPDVFFIKQNKQ